MIPLLVFLGSLVADYGSSLWAINRGLSEGNPILAADPLWVGSASALVVICLGEHYRRRKARGWQTIFWIGSGVHAVAFIWNTVMLVRGHQ